MTPNDMNDLAKLLQNVPGLKSIDFRDVRRLATLLRDSPEIGSIEVKGWFGTGVVITRTSVLTAATAAPVVLPGVAMGAGAVHAERPAEAREPEGGRPAAPAVALKEIKSPMVGTFYKAPEPGAEPYVKAGSRVTSGQTVCIIEAMKIMNEIEAEFSGVVREILVNDTTPVEYGQVLFRIDPNG